MSLAISYGEEIVVGVCLRQEFAWYVSEKELWFLDYRRWFQAFINSGCEDEHLRKMDFSGRFNIPVVDENSSDVFILNMAAHRVSSRDLQGLLRAGPLASFRDEVIHLMPSLFVDFDHSFLGSAFYEGGSFEDFVPKGWHSKYLKCSELLSLIPDQYRYWIIDGVDLYSQLRES